MNHSPFGADRDKQFMELALEQAHQAAAADEVPIGAIIVDADGNVIGKGHNQVESEKSQIYHAEVVALKQAGVARNDWRLDGCWLFVTLKPCSMCMWLARLSRIDGIVYAAESPLFGYQLDNEQPSRVYKKDIAVITGVGCAESEQLLKQFFKVKRNKKGE